MANSAGKYKYRDLKVHGTSEWLTDNKRKYRQVFDCKKTKYIYVELSLFNLMFDKEDWQADVQFKCYDQYGSVKCDKVVSQAVNKKDNIAYVKYSWGVDKPGDYWKKGTYHWEAILDGVSLGSKYFYILDEGEVTSQSNPYFSLSTIKLYEGPAADVPYGQRNYLKALKFDSTRYLWIEFEGTNLQFNKMDWQGEFFFRIRNSIGESIAEIVDFYTYYSNGKLIRFTRGWGSETPGNWFHGDYTLDVVFLENLVARVNFTIGDTQVADTDGGKFYLPGQEGFGVTQKTDEPRKEMSEEEIMKELNEMIGLEKVKESIKDKYDYLKFLKLRKEKGIDDDERMGLHTVFTGNPGTGKTKVAQLLGKIYYNLGLLSKGHVHEVDRADIIGEFIGATAPKTKEAIKKARGGILFIDEAYSLAREGDTERDFGKEAIEIILKEMSDGEGDLAIIVAGYPEEMMHFLNSNPGMKSRFNSYVTFPDYTPTELLAIAKYAANNLDVTIEKPGEEFLYTKLVEAYRDRDRTFGNARYVNSIVGEAKVNMGLRIMDDKAAHKLDAAVLSMITLPDIQDIFKRQEKRGVDIPVDEEYLRDALQELNNLIGIETVKSDITEMVKLVKYYREIGKDVKKMFSLHSVFTGNPGTGKTTVARIMARIFRGLGVLERGHLVEVDREGLVAGYIGQTAIKTSEKIDEAMGGVLFIDEAYSLVKAGGSFEDFGNEAIEVLLKRMEDKRGEFVVITAGYPRNMDEFLNSNPGLKSRFDRKFIFPDYNEEELFVIAKKILNEQNLVFDSEASEYFKKFISVIYKQRDEFFGNAREIRKALGVVVKNQNLRLAELTKAKRTEEMIKTIVLDDVKELPSEVIDGEKVKFGFDVKVEK